MIYLLVFTIGTVIGSFLNVCIRRMPDGKSIVMPGSHCMQCKKPIEWYDNIPLVSYILLRGKCRHCKVKIPFQYFLVELITAVLLIALFSHFGLTIKFFIFSLFTGLLIIATFTDFNEMIIPDEISLGGLGVGLVISLFFTPWYGGIIGAVVGGGTIYLLGLVGQIAFRKKIKEEGLEGAMGGGDVKLMAMMGAFLGWKLVLLTFFIAPFLALIPGLISKYGKNRSDIPYGPYLVIAALIALFFGKIILRRFLC